MTTVGIIGSGHIGVTIARLAIGAGYSVVLSNSRGPRSLAGTVSALGPRATAATSADAAASDLVVVSVPLSAFAALPAVALAGKTVIDTCNYGPERDGHVPELDSGAMTSSELLQRYLPGAAVVKAFNTIFSQHLLSLGRPPGSADRSSLPLAGDDVRAKAEASAFIAALGYDVVDTGSLADSWRQETGTPVWGAPYGPYSVPEGRPAASGVIRAALDSATRATKAG